MFLSRLFHCLKRRHLDSEEREEERKAIDDVEQRSIELEHRLRLLEEEGHLGRFRRRET